MADSILERWDITAEDLTKVIDRNPSLRGMIIGYDDLPTSSYRKYTDYQRRHLLATLVNVSWPPQPPFLEEPFTLMNEIIQNRI